MRTLYIGILIVASVLLAGCFPEPGYRMEVVTFDEGMLGTWDLAKPEQSERVPLTITERKATAAKGRFSGFAGLEGKSSDPHSREARAYSFCLTAPGEGGKPATPAHYDAVLLKIDNESYLGIQRASADLPQGGVFGDLLPIHVVIKIKREGDLLTMQSAPKRMLVWIPLVTPIDEPETKAKVPPADGLWLVSDPDRLIECIRLANKTPGYWDEPGTAHRIP